MKQYLIYDITRTHNGNKLTSLAGTTNASYTYDANGNINYDGRKNIDIEYNLLNLPHTVSENSTIKATYKYVADGTKASAIGDNGVGFEYLGSLVYNNNNGPKTLESTSFGGGRINKSNSDYEIDYFITDHLGSTRVIVNPAGDILEQNDYYPFGMRHDNPNLIASTSRWGYNGKKKQIVSRTKSSVGCFFSEQNSKIHPLLH